LLGNKRIFARHQRARGGERRCRLDESDLLRSGADDTLQARAYHLDRVAVANQKRLPLVLGETHPLCDMRHGDEQAPREEPPRACHTGERLLLAFLEVSRDADCGMRQYAILAGFCIRWRERGKGADKKQRAAETTPARPGAALVHKFPHGYGSYRDSAREE